MYTCHAGSNTYTINSCASANCAGGCTAANYTAGCQAGFQGGYAFSCVSALPSLPAGFASYDGYFTDSTCAVSPDIVSYSQLSASCSAAGRSACLSRVVVCSF